VSSISTFTDVYGVLWCLIVQACSTYVEFMTAVLYAVVFLSSF